MGRLQFHFYQAWVGLPPTDKNEGGVVKEHYRTEESWKKEFLNLQKSLGEAESGDEYL